MKIICPSCNYVGESKSIARGSKKMEVLLWCCLLVPGMLYTMWRQSQEGRYQGCPHCLEPKVRVLRKKDWKVYERSGRIPAI